MTWENFQKILDDRKACAADLHAQFGVVAL